MNTPQSEPITGPGITWAMEQIGKRLDSSMKKEPVEQSTVETQNDSIPRSLYTPGPWTVKENSTQLDIDGSVAIWREDEHLATVCGTIDGSPIANARLIAAAPELLEACRLVQDWRLSDDCKLRLSREGSLAFSKLGAAIAKAEGRAE